jgi:hypothetical protein
VASISSLPHPIYGVQGGAIALGTAFIALLVPDPWTFADRDSSNRRKLAWLPAIGYTGVGAAILGTSVLVFWWWPYQGMRAGMLSTTELFDILARFRSPHHYFPSHFRPQDFLTTALFVVTAWLAFDRWSRSVDRRTAALLLLPTVAVGLGCIAGTLFMEVWPLRAVLTLQPFRLLSIVKWTGYLLIGWAFAESWQKASAHVSRPLVAASLLSAGGTFPLVATAALETMRLEHRRRSTPVRVMWIGAVVTAAGGFWWLLSLVDERVRLVSALALLAAFWPDGWKARVTGALATIALVLFVAWNRSDAWLDVAPLRVIFSFDDLRNVDAQTARAAAAHTPADAVFVAPPEFGILRLVGRRALVVDFEAVPFQDEQMRAWRERLRVVYGDVSGGGFAARDALDNAYHTMTDVHLRELADRFGATHAVLYRDTPTALPELYSNDAYRIVGLRDR